MRMLAQLARLSRRFVAARRGVAAIEFAMVLPVLAILFLATFDGGRALAIYMKVRAATYTVDAVTNQYPSISSAQMSDIVGATAKVLSPYSSAPLVVTISQIQVNSKSSAVIAWSYSLNGSALSGSVTVPTSLATCGSYPCYLIYGQVSYIFTPMFGFFTTSTVNLSDSLYTVPRGATCIAYTPLTGTGCTAS